MSRKSIEVRFASIGTIRLLDENTLHISFLIFFLCVLCVVECNTQPIILT